MNGLSLQYTQERSSEIMQWVREQRKDKSIRNTLIKIFISVVAAVIAGYILRRFFS
jgi:hypothetical protein